MELSQIAEEIKPHPLVIKTLTKLSSVIPKWKIVPTKDITDSAFKNPDWRDEAIEQTNNLIIVSTFMLSLTNLH